MCNYATLILCVYMLRHRTYSCSILNQSIMLHIRCLVGKYVSIKHSLFWLGLGTATLYKAFFHRFQYSLSLYKYFQFYRTYKQHFVLIRIKVEILRIATNVFLTKQQSIKHRIVNIVIRHTCTRLSREARAIAGR